MTVCARLIQAFLVGHSELASTRQNARTFKLDNRTVLGCATTSGKTLTPPQPEKPPMRSSVNPHHHRGYCSFGALPGSRTKSGAALPAVNRRPDRND